MNKSHFLYLLGVLVINVTWRGKTYVGTLLDSTRHVNQWAPPRYVLYYLLYFFTVYLNVIYSYIMSYDTLANSELYVVNVGTNRPFSGRIYALGRSETCNVDVISSDSFRLDLTMAGQDCNTQSVVSILLNIIKYIY